MLLLSKMILDKNIVSLRTSREVAKAQDVIIDPNNLKIEGIHCIDSLNKQHLILLSQDIRDILPIGIVVNDHSSLSEPEELIRLKKTIELQFSLIGKPVFTNSKKKLGKITDYAFEPTSMFIKKLYITQSLLKSITGNSMSIDRTQIIEITNKKIVVKDPLQLTPANVPALNPTPAS